MKRGKDSNISVQDNDQSETKTKKIKRVLERWNKAKASELTLPHGQVPTPVYMPVGTKGSIKGLTSHEMEQLDCRILLGNTYHLGFQPSADFMQRCGGLHKFMSWERNILTDSGGFQMVSLSKLCSIDEDCVTFQSPVDGSTMKLRPEDSIHIQNCIGADIMMQLDDVIKTTTEGPRVEEAMHRTLRWLDRCAAAHQQPTKQNLFPIVQGGLDFNLRRQCIAEMNKRNLNGYAIGGLAGGESKDDFWKIVNLCTDLLPKDKPIYLMGVGYPVDLVVCSCLGVDMFDCVFSTRTARFGTAFTKFGFIKLAQQKYEFDLTPIESECKCQTCQTYTKAFLHSIINKEEVACHLITTHNLHYLLTLMKDLRQSILDHTLELFVNSFLQNYFIHEKNIPDWVIDALQAAKLQLNIKFV